MPVHCFIKALISQPRGFPTPQELQIRASFREDRNFPLLFRVLETISEQITECEIGCFLFCRMFKQLEISVVAKIISIALKLFSLC